jgi:hypothetical protein
MVYQWDSPIRDSGYNARKPIETTAPVQLFHPVFGHFLDDLSRNLPVPSEMVMAVVRYMRAASADYDSRENRRHILEPYLHCIFPTAVTTVVNADKTSPDGIALVPLAGKSYELVVALLNDEQSVFGDGGCDSLTLAKLSVAQCWAQDEVDSANFHLLLPSLTHFL